MLSQPMISVKASLDSMIGTPNNFTQRTVIDGRGPTDVMVSKAKVKSHWHLRTEKRIMLVKSCKGGLKC